MVDPTYHDSCLFLNYEDQLNLKHSYGIYNQYRAFDEVCTAFVVMYRLYNPSGSSIMCFVSMITVGLRIANDVSDLIVIKARRYASKLCVHRRYASIASIFVGQS